MSEDTDSEYDPPGEEDSEAFEAPEKEPKTRQTLLNRLWPDIEKNSKKGLRPRDIAIKLNKKNPPADHVTGHQISGKISRMKTTGRIKLPAKLSGPAKASKTNGMFCSVMSLFLR
jgi:hypothetical protein